MTASVLRGTAVMPADKSIAQRALIFAALADVAPHAPAVTVTIDRPGADVLSTARALHTLGALDFAESGTPQTTNNQTANSNPVTNNQAASALPQQLTVHVRGRAAVAARLAAATEPITLDCGNSGTGMRLLMGACAALLANQPGTIILTGDASLSARPMERVAQPLRQMGAQIETTAGHAPVTIHGPAPLHASYHDLAVPSAQLLSAIMLAACAADGETTIALPGPARDHTERMLAFLGADVAHTHAPDSRSARLRGPASIEARSIRVPGDFSAAAFWLVAATIHPDADITLPRVGLNPTRIALIHALQQMGADIEVVERFEDGPEPAGTLRVRSAARVRPLEIEAAQAADMIDELPILAVAMAGADGVSSVRGAAELRVKESDRIALTVELLHTMGVAAKALPDGWRITGSSARHRAAGPASPIRTAADHRIAMAAVIAELAGISPDPLTLDDPGCVAVSYPGFFDDAATLGGH